jgi:hypothetical protein
MKNYYLSLVAIFSILSFIKNDAQAQQTCFTISDSENKIYKFRLSDGTILDSEALSSLSSPEASTLNLAGDTLWILNQDELHYVNTSGSSLSNTKVSGSNISGQTLTGALGNKTISDFDAMSVDANGNIWAGTSSNDPCLLVVIDPSTGNVKENFFGSNVDYLVVNNSSYSALRFDAMAFDPLNNELYANMNGTSQNYDYLFKINTSSGAIELVRQFNTISDVEGMAFDAIGDLYVVTGSNASSSSDDNKLWKVDLINGDVTQKYSLWGGDMETCDCILGDPITSVEVSGYVFYDANEDTTFNTSNDVGVTGFLVNLYKDANNNGVYDAGTDQFVDSTRTYADGFYKFRLNYTSGTDNYVLVSNSNDLPSGNDYTTDNIETATFTAGRQKDENNNFGYVADNNTSVNIITGTVFADMNENGSLESAYEGGVPGVTVYLFEDTDCDGTIDYGESVLDSSVVAADGKYSFVQNYDTSGSTSSSTETISKRISSDNDDAEEYSDGDMTRSSSDLDLGEYLVGLRFQALSIPQGATITQAYITFTGTETETGSNSVTICGQNSNDAASFSSSDDDISNRPKTSKLVNWSPTSWVNNGKYNTPNLNEIVEAIVGRTGWNSGNDMAFIIKPNGGDRDAYTHDDNSSKAALLTVVYQTGSTTSSNSSKVCYNTSIDELSVPAGASMTTDNIESQQFTSGGNTDENNDFGLWGGALPVEWLSIKGRWIPSGAEVKWATGSEDNNSHFVIERTHDGAHWEVIGDMTGAGFSTVISRYTFIDENPYSDVNYYRVKQVDFDGQFDYSDVVMVHSNIEKADFDIIVYPNSTKDVVTIEWNKGDRNSKIYVMDINGKVIRSVETNANYSATVDMSNIDSGIYFIQFISNNETKTERLVVKH